MEKSVMVAYSEVDEIINMLDEEHINKIPYKLRNAIHENKLNNYNTNINKEKPLKEQHISRKALAILAVLNYNYWCTDELEKERLLERYNENEKLHQEILRKKYNPDNIFENKIPDNKNNETKYEDKQMIVYNQKESIWKNIINKIKSILFN